ncbi:MAG TPA: (2Fe-2S)-binding protein [Actinomycetota bacterium]|jgi:aerobic-type carbon monoxide dehydrogenase small subunit (CoxS/CutS family)|nr:(2Fe-2S)-binding protein [Actinomycetota bacterium]
MARREIELRVNGRSLRGSAEPRTTLADFLRDELGLTGTHLGCEHGVCGACTILLDGRSVRSCLLFALQAQGSELRTVEGLADPDGPLHPIQEAFSEHHGLQCGFCTPGFLMSVCELLADDPDPGEQEIRAYLSGNLCRCTGYQNIVAAVQAAAGKLREAGAGGPGGSRVAPRGTGGPGG